MKIPHIFFIFPFFEIFRGAFAPFPPYGATPEYHYKLLGATVSLGTKIESVWSHQSARLVLQTCYLMSFNKTKTEYRIWKKLVYMAYVFTSNIFLVLKANNLILEGWLPINHNLVQYDIYFQNKNNFPTQMPLLSFTLYQLLDIFISICQNLTL